MYSPNQEKALVFVPIATGLSFFGSSGLIVMILWFSRIKLSAVARRILLGLCDQEPLSQGLGLLPTRTNSTLQRSVQQSDENR